MLGVGEIGLNKNSRNELTILEEQIDVAARYGQLILVHTPHLEDKRKGTQLIMDAIRANADIDPGRVLIDHVEEHTIEHALDAGFWVGITLYPLTKCTPERAVDMVERYGTERILVNSAGDWGPSNPMNTPDFIRTLRKRGRSEEFIQSVVYDNPLRFFSQAKGFNFNPPVSVRDSRAGGLDPVPDDTAVVRQAR